ncbi:exonuclease V [Acinetobacter phage Presley]|uniref:DNA helicase n=1 Tax=Acinetobacter phage Presley TaxID=1406780 RepID=U5PWH9_9CAUD|nr:exonuclease V [Acinetobacter phage Presley]AGY48101.1 DNA helicase [Acinetobacter phage Presley]
MSVTLSNDQQIALAKLIALLGDPNQKYLCIMGAAGTGKTTLMRTFLEKFHQYQKSIQSLNPKHVPHDLVFTATTNKAVEALETSLGQECKTIHSFLGLTLTYENGKEVLADRKNMTFTNKLIVIDESSYIDEILMEYLLAKTKKCKIVFMGDPEQLTPVGLDYSPAFDDSLDSVTLSQIMRQADDNPIQDFSRKLREYVQGGPLPNPEVDDIHIIHMDKNEFNAAMLRVFTDTSYTHSQAKFLCWRNATAIRVGQMIKEHVSSTPNFAPGDYAVSNRYLKNPIRNIKTDQIVFIRSVKAATQFGVPGYEMTLGNGLDVFMPANHEDIDKTKQKLFETKRSDFYKIDQSWVDLRPVYACTIHKSQGSTYDTVFIDLDDFHGCKDQDLLARLLYVGISRARERIILTGEL